MEKAIDNGIKAPAKDLSHPNYNRDKEGHYRNAYFEPLEHILVSATSSSVTGTRKRSKSLKSGTTRKLGNRTLLSDGYYSCEGRRGLCLRIGNSVIIYRFSFRSFFAFNCR